MTATSAITPVQDLENRCEPERAGPALPREEWLNRTFNTTMPIPSVPICAPILRIFEMELYLADVRAAIENLDLERILCQLE